jgi:hypothetical protein
MTRYSRAEIGLRPPKAAPVLNPTPVEGIALHWPAMSRPLRGFGAVAAALRGWQNYHMDGRGYWDIAYQVAVDQDGNRYELRGLATQSGANGNEDVNERFGAVLLVIAPGEEPTPAMVATTRDVIAEHRRMFGHSRRIVGHGQIRPDGTACPGPAAQRLINAGTFEPRQAPEPSEEDDMKLDDPLNPHDPRGNPDTANVTVGEALSALVISLTQGDAAAKNYLERAAKSPAPKRG